ncbi:MAG: metallophosphoesterase [Phycisphaeraceae bacterium]|nr:metallophosphoesterase [Phycisphaeraceae bacterium]
MRIITYLSLTVSVLFVGLASAESPDSHHDDDSSLRFGVCTDVHREILHDVDLRLRTFVRDMNARDVDFIIQLGDFCQPQTFNEPFMDIWNNFEGPKYHVLGNHDMDNHMGSEKFASDFTAKYFGMPDRYYSFDSKGFHFIVLDGNDVQDPPQSGYPSHIGSEQMEWLKDDLSKTNLPTIIFSHQSLEWGVDNAEEVRAILEAVNEQSNSKKVIACFSGHHHVDHLSAIHGIYYVHVNSMSYSFLGKEYIQLERYGARMDTRYYKIKETAPYRDPLYAVVTIAKDGTITIDGTDSEWVGPSPQELGAKRYPDEMVVPRITDRTLAPLD